MSDNKDPIEITKPPVLPQPPWSTPIPKPKMPPDAARVRPDVMQTILLDEIAGRLEEMVERLGGLLADIEKQMMRIPQGIMVPVDVKVEGTTLQSIGVAPLAGGDWFACSIQNSEDSQSNVLVSVNSSIRGFRELRPSEAMDINFYGPKIRTIYYKCKAPTDTAILHIVGTM